RRGSVTGNEAARPAGRAIGVTWRNPQHRRHKEGRPGLLHDARYCTTPRERSGRLRSRGRAVRRAVPVAVDRAPRPGGRARHLGIPCAGLSGRRDLLATLRDAPGAPARTRRDPPMIRPLRRAHRAIALLLAALLPLIVAAALAARHSW